MVVYGEIDDEIDIRKEQLNSEAGEEVEEVDV